MGALFWIKRYLLAAVPLFAILAAVEWFKGSTSRDDYLSAAVWAVIAAAIFTYAAWRRYRSNQACAVCDSFDAGAKPKKPGA
jgi:hypothetical protein